MKLTNKNIVVDLDNTLLDFRFPHIGKPMQGAIKAINSLIDTGYRIIIYSCRNNPDLFTSVASMNKNLKDTENALKEYGFKDFTIDEGITGKPIALYYIDDAGAKFDIWQNTLNKYSFYPGMTIAMGVEDCILDKDNELIDGASEALDYFSETGINVILTSIRSNIQNTDLEQVKKSMVELENILKGYKLQYNFLEYCYSGKPVCSYYIDPNMIPFKGNWEVVLNTIKNDQDLQMTFDLP